MAGNRRAGTRRVFARSTLSCALLSLAMVPAAQTNQPPADFGSVPSGTASNEVLRLTLRDAINRAVRYNLGQIESGENARIARGQRLRALSTLLPQVSASASENVEQFSAATLGIKIPQVPAVIGPFSFSEAQASASQTLFNFESIQRFRAAKSSEQAAQLENATGNYVKVVERLPVKIVLEPGENRGRHLRPGMNVVPKVYLR